MALFSGREVGTRGESRSLAAAAGEVGPAPRRTLSRLQEALAKASDYAPLLGRILLSQIFLISGVAKVLDWSGTAEEMTRMGMVLVPFFLPAAMLVELGGGLSLLLGWKARLG